MRPVDRQLLRIYLSDHAAGRRHRATQCPPRGEEGRVTVMAGAGPDHSKVAQRNETDQT